MTLLSSVRRRRTSRGVGSGDGVSGRSVDPRRVGVGVLRGTRNRRGGERRARSSSSSGLESGRPSRRRRTVEADGWSPRRDGRHVRPPLRGFQNLRNTMLASRGAGVRRVAGAAADGIERCQAVDAALGRHWKRDVINDEYTRTPARCERRSSSWIPLGEDGNGSVSAGEGDGAHAEACTPKLPIGPFARPRCRAAWGRWATRASRGADDARVVPRRHDGWADTAPRSLAMR